jgi:uncharacterized membrane protein
MIRRSFFLFFTFVLANTVFALTPMPHLLSQSKLDKFISDYHELNRSGILNEEWQKAVQQVNSTLFMDSSISEEISAAPLNMSYILMYRSIEKVKKSINSNNELAKFKWNNEYWDIMVIISFSFQYSQIIESYRHAGQEIIDGEESKIGMKPITYYIDKQDYMLVNKNSEQINEAMQKEDEAAPPVNAG